MINLNQLDVTSLEIAQQLIGLVDGNFQRRINQQVRLDYYYDKQLKYLKQAIKNQFKFPDRLNLQTEFMNVTRMIVDELGSIYIESPRREIKGGTDTDNEIFNLIQEQSSFDSLMDTNNKLVKLCKTTLVRPVWRDEQIEYIIYTPNMFDVLEDPNNPKKPLAVIYAQNYDSSQYVTYDGMTYDKQENPDQFKGDEVVYHVWTSTRYFMFGIEIDPKTGVKTANILDNEDNQGNVNPYGTLDIFVPFRDEFAYDRFFIEGGDDLINANELINVKKTELNYLTKMQSFGIPVRKGASSDANVFIADPSMTIDLPADDDMSRGSDFKFASPDPKINELSADILSKLRSVAIKYKLNPEMFRTSGEKSSAESIQLQNFYLYKAITRDKPRYAQYEANLFDATRVVYNMHNANQLSDGSRLSVNFSDAEMPISQESQDAHNLLLLVNGIQSKAQWLLKTDPDLGTIENAIARLTEIEVENGTTQQPIDTI